MKNVIKPILGPYHISLCAGPRYVIDAHDLQITVESVMSKGRPDLHAETNANLIAAAPELLETLEYVREQLIDITKEHNLSASLLVDITNTCTSMIPALKKARGLK